MWEAIAGAGISAGSSLLGGILSNAQSSANNAQQWKLAQQQLQWQRDLATQGIRWKVHDAQAAGIHPLYALGASTIQPSPVSINPSEGGMGEAVGRMGQDIGRAVAATQTKEERVDTVMRGLQVQRAELENQLLASQIAKLNASQVGPGLPSNVSPPGVVASPTLGTYEAKPPEVNNPNPSGPSQTAGPAAPYNRWLRSGDGLVSEPAPGNKAEDEFGAPLMVEWWMRNRTAPFLGSRELAPSMDVVQAAFPGAVGVRFSRSQFKWVPIYPGKIHTHQGQRTWYSAPASPQGMYSP